MNIYNLVLFSSCLFLTQSALGQDQARPIKTGGRPAEVREINNTPVIMIHKSNDAHDKGNSNMQQRKSPRCIKKVGACTEGGDRKKELKEPVRINENQ